MAFNIQRTTRSPSGRGSGSSVNVDVSTGSVYSGAFSGIVFSNVQLFSHSSRFFRVGMSSISRVFVLVVLASITQFSPSLISCVPVVSAKFISCPCIMQSISLIVNLYSFPVLSYSISPPLIHRFTVARLVRSSSSLSARIEDDVSLMPLRSFISMTLPSFHIISARL